MTELQARMRSASVWLVPAALLVLLIGWETRWGSRMLPEPSAPATTSAQPVQAVLLPEYRLDGGLEARRETIERTLFNPTRRPAPPQAAPNAAQQMLQRGQFVLTGTTVVGDKATAFLRELNGGKPRRVQKGENINGMTVAEVGADRVKLTLGDESEELTLKVAAGPRSTVQPAPQPMPGQPVIGQPMPQGASQVQVATPPPAFVQDVGEVLAQRRRAARAAEAANAQAPQVTPAQPAGAAAPDPRWQDVYRGLAQPRR